MKQTAIGGGQENAPTENVAALYDPNKFLDDLSPLAIMGSDTSTMPHDLIRLLQKYYGDNLPSAEKMKATLIHVAKYQSFYDKQGGVPRELIEQEMMPDQPLAAGAFSAHTESHREFKKDDLVIRNNKSGGGEGEEIKPGWRGTITMICHDHVHVKGIGDQDNIKVNRSFLDLYEEGSDATPENAVPVTEQAKPQEPEPSIFGDLKVPEEPLAPKAAEEGAVAIAEATTLAKGGALSNEDARDISQAVLGGDIEEAKTIIIRGKSAASTIPHSEEVMRAREQYDPQALVQELKESMRGVSKQVIGREELLTQTLYALLTREHQLIYSRAGLAKSLYATAVFGQFEGSRAFSVQMTKGTTEEGLVGAVNLQELKKGSIVHETKGSIVDAEFAFLDEIFDSNDVALRSLLGILNERLFRKGKQYVEAVLHSAIATSNYVRATEITEAVIDRFPFRAYMMPSHDPYQMLRIDETYARNVGKVRIPGENNQDRKIPFEYVDFLADVAEGREPGREITAPPHVLFLKNAVILEYVKLVNEARASAKKDKRPELYISPRTMAKTRDILNASALLRGNTEVTKEDLNDLKYMVCTIGDQEDQEQYFEKALSNTLANLTASDLEVIDLFMGVHTMTEEILELRKDKSKISFSFIERVKMFFGLTDISDLTFGKIRGMIENISPNNAMVNDLKQSILKRIESESERMDGKLGGVLF